MFLFYAWLKGSENPYCLYNGLGPDYRPWHAPESAPRPPQFPERVRAFIYACGWFARELQMRDMKVNAQMMGSR